VVEALYYAWFTGTLDMLVKLHQYDNLSDTPDPDLQFYFILFLSKLLII
jgi:hypothetical protein